MSCDEVFSTLLLADEPDYVLFKVAINFAKKGLSTWFISLAPFEKLPKKLQKPSKEALQLISFIYLKDYLDLLKHLNGIHKWTHIPDIIIVKNFETYCNFSDVEYNATQAAFLCSVLVDCLSFIAKKKGKAYLLACCFSSNIDQNSLNKKIKPLYDMYFKNFITRNDFTSEEELIDNIERSFNN